MEHKGFPSEGVKPEGVLPPPMLQEVHWKVPEEIGRKVQLGFVCLFVCSF